MIPAIAEGQELYLRTALATLMEGRAQAPLSVSGRAFSVEAGVAIPGESSYALELGVRGRALAPAESQKTPIASSSLGLTGGARARIGVLPLELELVPIFVGGLQISLHYDRDPDHDQAVATRLGLGPHLAIGLEKKIMRGVVLAAFLHGRSEIVPAALELGGMFELRVE